MTRARLITLAVGLGLALLLSPIDAAHAQREHRVRSGQTLSHVARRYHVSVGSLAAANGIRRDAMLREGQVLRIPERGVVYVRSGQSLSLIARRNDVSVRELARINRIRPDASLQVGQRLVLPGHDPDARAAADRWGRPRTPGVATFYRLSKRETLRIRLIDSRGRARAAARRRLAHLLRHRSSGSERLPNGRLVQLLARISDHFGGRKIIVVSGYRPAGGYTRETSRHVAGRAIDFRIKGVPKAALRDYLRTLHDVGVGFYPRSSFVHLDVRDRSAYWVDWSRPGQRPQYERRGARPDDVTADEARLAGVEVREAPEEESPAEGATPAPDEGESESESQPMAPPPSEPEPTTPAAATDTEE